MVYNLKPQGFAAHGKFAHIGLDKYWITGQVEGIDGDFDRDTADGTTLGAKAENSLPGIAKGNVKVEAKYSTDLNRKIEPLKWQADPVLGWVAQLGLAEGLPITMMPMSVGKYSWKLSKKDEVAVSMEWNTRGDFHDGIIHVDPNNLLTGATGTCGAQDNTDYGGATTYGGYAYMFFWGFVGGTNPSLTLKLQHSDDDAAYTDLCTFGSVTEPGAYRVEIPSTTTIEAFTQAHFTLSGTPTGAQALVGLGRDFNPAPSA